MTVQETASLLQSLDQVLILTHKRPDGDTIGCAAALCLGLRQLGKTAWVLPNEDAHGLFDPYFQGVLAPADFQPQVAVSVDVASQGMLPESAAPWKDNILLCIDHHGSNEGYAQHTLVDPAAAACGEIITKVLTQLGVTITAPIALLLYMAIATDTGCFVYSNTTPETHRIAADLMETGFDAQWVNKRHFRVKSLKRMQIESRLVRDMDLEQNGSLVFAYVTLDMIRELQATEEDLEDISSFIGLLERGGQRRDRPATEAGGVQDFPAHRRQEPERLPGLRPLRRRRPPGGGRVHHPRHPRPVQGGYAGRDRAGAAWLTESWSSTSPPAGPPTTWWPSSGASCM